MEVVLGGSLMVIPTMSIILHFCRSLSVKESVGVFTCKVHCLQTFEHMSAGQAMRNFRYIHTYQNA